MNSIADFYGISREELLFDSLREKEGLPLPEPAEKPAPCPINAQKTENGNQADAPSQTNKDKKHRMRAWVIALSILCGLLIFDLVLFSVENLPIENGSSVLGIALDWRNLGIAVLVLLLIIAAAFGAALLLRTRKEKARRIFYVALCLLLAGIIGAGSLTALLCKDAFFAERTARRGFAAYVRLDLQGNYDGNVTAQATNNFTLGYDKVEVKLYLYSSGTYTENTEEMTLIKTALSDSLDIFRRISVAASVAENEEYWRAQVLYKTNGTGWKQLQTKTLRFNDRAIKI